MLSSFTVGNYRAFAREQKVEIRPLTLFFGWNSSGKSALVRFLPLLAESVKNADQTIYLGGEVGKGAAWPELVCKAKKLPNLKFALNWDKGAFEAKWDVNGDSAGTWQENKSIQLQKGSTRMPFDPAGNAPTGWAGYPDPEAISIPGDPGPVLAELHSLITAFVKDVQWIDGIRARLPRLTPQRGEKPAALKPDGSNALEHLIAAQLRSINDPLLEAVNSFFSALGEQLVLESLFDNNWRVMLRPPDTPDMKVNLCDTGEGYTQVLPILVALARARADGPRLLCLEQPELHLHTRAQAVLAKQLVATANSEQKPTLLVETHSEVLLTSVQLAIASGAILAEMVRVYWVEPRKDGTSEAFPVDFDQQGRPNNSMLAGAFDEAFTLGSELMAQQMTNRNAGGKA